MKFFYFLFLTAVFLFRFGHPVLAVDFWDYCDTPMAQYDQYLSYYCSYYVCQDLNSCTSGLCIKTDSVASCNNKPCTANNTSCCSNAESWTKYDVSCKAETRTITNEIGKEYSETRCFVYYTPSVEKVCNIGDKCLNGYHGISGEIGLRATNSCDCGEITYSNYNSHPYYKYCCSVATGNSTLCTPSDLDGQDPPEGSCNGLYLPVESYPNSSNSHNSTYYVSSNSCVKRIDGQCNNFEANKCITGTVTNKREDSTNYYWDCLGQGYAGIRVNNCSFAKGCPTEVTCNSTNCGKTVADGDCGTKVCPACANCKDLAKCDGGTACGAYVTNSSGSWFCDCGGNNTAGTNDSTRVCTSKVKYFKCNEPKNGTCTTTSSYYDPNDCGDRCIKSDTSIFRTNTNCSTLCTTCSCGANYYNCSSGTPTLVGNDGCGVSCYSCGTETPPPSSHTEFSGTCSGVDTVCGCFMTGCSSIDANNVCTPMCEDACYTYPFDYTPNNGIDGACNPDFFGKSSNVLTSSSNLCTSGTAQNFRIDGNYYLWSCAGTLSTCTDNIANATFEGGCGGTCTIDGCVYLCSGSNGISPFCYAIVNNPPTFESLTIRNISGGIVSPDSENRNQICDTNFENSRQITFNVTASDLDIGDSLSVTLSWNGHNFDYLGKNENIYTFGLNSGAIPSDWNNSSVHPLVVTITDSKGSTVTNSSRYFKIWDCQLPVSGGIYDSTGVIVSCSTGSGFTNLANRNVLNFKSLVFHNTNNENDDPSMTKSDTESTYTGVLTWGNSYNAEFNSDISISDQKIRVNSGAYCPNWTVDTSVIDPYSTSPSALIDFTGIIIKDPWWQTQNGGVISNLIKGEVPTTCNGCKLSPDGLISSLNINNVGKSIGSDWWLYKGKPFSVTKDINTNYNYFFNQYLAKKGIGVTNATLTDIINNGNPGVYFVDGNLNITDNIIKNGNFLMIIVNGDIGVTDSVTRVDGILVANNISASGSNDTQLIFNGSLYTSNDVDFSRDHKTRVKNNTAPAVVVNYDPSLIFNMPKEVTKVLTNWQWGN